MEIKLEAVQLEFPEGSNIILGQSHFIKTVEDLHEVMVNCNAQAKFGLAFSEASGARLIRKSGTDNALTDIAVKNIEKIGCGHTFVIIIRDSFPVNYLPRIKDVPEVVNIFCASANQVSAIIARTDDGGGILGVIDGASPVGIEGDIDAKWRHDFLRKIGYKQ